MSTALKRKLRTRTSKVFCQEKFDCLKEKAAAEIKCTQCASFQCANCEKNIHKSKPQFEDHERLPIEPPPYEELCQIDSLSKDSKCEEKNFADLRCDECKRCFCLQCFDDYHKGSKSKHKKITFKEYKKRLLQEQQLQDAIQPSSPLSIEDESLTFQSFPQQQLYESGDSMTSFTSFHSDHSQKSQPDICLQTSDSGLSKALEESQIDARFEQCSSFILVDENEKLQAEDVEDFLSKLGCEEDTLVKVVSIFGNTGDGKSYTLNHTFFGGSEVFQTSASQASCTLGVWASFDQDNKAIIIDTEGLLGVTCNQNQRTRLLLKLLAISDVVIYRTRAERLHNDMFHFLGDASKAYSTHFTAELKAVSTRCHMKLDVTKLSPAVIVFHETQNTSILGEPTGAKEAELQLRDRFKELGCSMDFSDLKYVGTRTLRESTTDFYKLQEDVQRLLRNNSIRAPRKPEIVFKTLEALNDKFSGDIENVVYSTFPDQYFTCTTRCLSCGERCTRSMNHDVMEDDHQTDPEHKCKYQHQFENKVYYCKKCYRDGKTVRVVPKSTESKDNAWMGMVKYVWAGDILECSNCGIIYRSRQFWYGNPDVENVVHEEVVHVWPEGNIFLIGTHNAARKVLDGLGYVAESISSVSAKPSKRVSDWMADQIAPSYWVPNSQIKKCSKCELRLTDEQKHHCRGCGRGFCDSCSSHRKPVPEKGWKQPVRVCEQCYTGNVMTDSASSTGSDSQVTARKMGETVSSAIDVVATAFTYPLGVLKDSARPAYWIPDEKIKECCVCRKEFGPKLVIHHCRACGQGVCEGCSPGKRPVPLRGWDYDVRVCKKCEKKKDKVVS